VVPRKGAQVSSLVRVEISSIEPLGRQVWDLSGQCPVSQQADEREQEALAFTVGKKVEAAQDRGRFDLVPAARMALISEPLPDTERGVD